MNRLGFMVPMRVVKTSGLQTTGVPGGRKGPPQPSPPAEEREMARASSLAPCRPFVGLGFSSRRLLQLPDLRFKLRTGLRTLSSKLEAGAAGPTSFGGNYFWEPV